MNRPLDLPPEAETDLISILGTRFPAWLRWSAEPAGKLLRLGTLSAVAKASGADGEAEGFFSRVLEVMGLRYEVQGNGEVPEDGPLIIVANHPFGAPEAIALADWLVRSRPDLKILANHLLGTYPALAKWVIPVDPFGSQSSAARNLGPLKTALRHLRANGALLIFPAGEVSAFQPKTGAVADKEWTPHLGTLVRMSGATVLPVFFPGSNSKVFHAAGLLHPLLRTALLPREFLRWRGKEISMRVGRPIDPKKLSDKPDDAALSHALRMRVELLGADERKAEGLAHSPAHRFPRRPTPKSFSTPEKIAVAIDPDLLAREVDTLDPISLLATQGGLEVYVARAQQIPHVLREIGRLREETFRSVGEGTGKALDLDDYDADYLHLFLWNPGNREVAGAYRLGLTDEILASKGPRGLYTTSLFRFAPGFFRRLGPAMELGRSFVTAAYQRKPHSLFLLWKGIATYAARNPRYRLLFGPVSISNDYKQVSKDLLVQFLRSHHGERKVSRWVAARHPFRPARDFQRHGRQYAKDFGSIEELSAVISDLEADGKGVPVLLRQYIRMNAALLKFNVDPDFSNAIDGLVLVDLLSSSPKLLGRYMGEDALEAFTRYHQTQNCPRGQRNRI